METAVGNTCNLSYDLHWIMRVYSMKIDNVTMDRHAVWPSGPVENKNERTGVFKICLRMYLPYLRCNFGAALCPKPQRTWKTCIYLSQAVNGQNLRAEVQENPVVVPQIQAICATIHMYLAENTLCLQL